LHSVSNIETTVAPDSVCAYVVLLLLLLLTLYVLLTHQGKSTTTTSAKQSDSKSDNPLPPELEHCDKALVEKIEAEIVHSGQVVTFDEIAGLEFAKKCVNELICW
jgi:hypothetical protein